MVLRQIKWNGCLRPERPKYVSTGACSPWPMPCLHALVYLSAVDYLPVSISVIFFLPDVAILPAATYHFLPDVAPLPAANNHFLVGVAPLPAATNYLSLDVVSLPAITNYYNFSYNNVSKTIIMLQKRYNPYIICKYHWYYLSKTA